MYTLAETSNHEKILFLFLFSDCVKIAPKKSLSETPGINPCGRNLLIPNFPSHLLDPFHFVSEYKLVYTYFETTWTQGSVRI